MKRNTEGQNARQEVWSLLLRRQHSIEATCLRLGTFAVLAAQQLLRQAIYCRCAVDQNIL